MMVEIYHKFSLRKIYSLFYFVHVLPIFLLNCIDLLFYNALSSLSYNFKAIKFIKEVETGMILHLINQ